MTHLPPVILPSELVWIWHDPESLPVDILKDLPLGQANVRLDLGTTAGGLVLPGARTLPDGVAVCSTLARTAPLQNRNAQDV